MESSCSTEMTPTAAEAGPSAAGRREPEAEVRLRRKTLESVLEQCQRALELLREADLGIAVPEEAPPPPLPPPPEGAEEEEAGGAEEAPAPAPSDTGYETDELCDLLKSRVESADFLEKLDHFQKSVYQNGAVDESTSWDIINATDVWDDKHSNGDDESEDGYVVVKQEDIVDGIACFMAAYLLSLEQTKELTPDQLQKALSKTFSTKKKKSKLQKAWDGTKVIYNLTSWSATAVGIYQNPAIIKAATAAFWTSCRVISKLL